MTFPLKILPSRALTAYQKEEDISVILLRAGGKSGDGTAGEKAYPKSRQLTREFDEDGSTSGITAVDEDALNTAVLCKIP